MIDWHTVLAIIASLIAIGSVGLVWYAFTRM